jgi:hypothetical protein
MVSLETTSMFKIFIPSFIICIIVCLFHYKIHPFPRHGIRSDGLKQ